MNRKLVLGLAASIPVAIGCASAPDSYPALEQAQAKVQMVDRDPLAEQIAGAELRQARQQLDRAQTLINEGAELDQIRHHAYLANRHAEIIEMRVAEQKAQSAIEESEAERTRVLLQAREQDAQRAEQRAAERAREAERAMTEAEQAMALAEQREREAEEQRQRAMELEAEIEELQAEQTERGLVLTLGDVLFDTNEAELKPGATPTVSRLAEFLDTESERNLLIEGHTDSRGEDSYNQDLSEQRAQAVREALVDQGIAASRINAKGMGERYPVATNDTAAGRQQNRRVEIVLSDTNGEFTEEAERSAST